MDDLVEVCAGKRFTVKMTSRVAKQYAKAEAKQRARSQKWMQFFADDGFEALNKEQMRHEGKFSIGDKSGTKAAIWAFKAWKLRVYGGMANDREFVATEIDIAKKQDAADRDLLESAAEKLRPYLEASRK